MSSSLFPTGEWLVDALADAPNPKPQAADKARFGQLASLYTAFSSEFASFALDVCVQAGCRSIADPFGGMGTMAEAARSKPLEMHLGDISPFAALSCAFRSAPAEEILRVIDTARSVANQVTAEDETTFFARMFDATGAQTPADFAKIMSSPTAQDHREAALLIYVVALGRLRLHKGLAGSNPTWVKRANIDAGGDDARRAIIETSEIARIYATQLPNIHAQNSTSVFWTDIESQPIEPETLDAIITSPPYANRTDYIRHYLPASELLLNLSGKDERSVRAKQIGTPLIRDVEPNAPLPAKITAALHSIRTHSSYASERYYFKGFLYYFSDMYNAVEHMRKLLKPGGLLFMVVQDTYYKDVYVPTADLLGEIAINVGMQAVCRRDWRVNQHLSRLSPHSRRRLPNKVLSESLIGFSR
ncbi:hypothetical protein [Phenylobacterium sp.]|uniref:hypothetical protein n=1 Tax=Phenylobacterium sp. TaxID=1871053 RepID=UPI002731F265|nr:hypothetical protein [Phenylobacterium sp.]MDP1617234.1 hypothetical protein [Phenylobacterium sp.]MDP1986811.1 hypothetical protein [Phenylobacterium sp.]